MFNEQYSEKKVLDMRLSDFNLGLWSSPLVSISPLSLSALELTLSGLIMGSRVDTADDNQNHNVIISKYQLRNPN